MVTPQNAQNGPQGNERHGRVISRDEHYDAASDYLNGHLQAAMKAAMLTTSDGGHGASLATAYIAGEALARNADQDGEGDGGDGDATEGSGAFVFSILAFMIGGASLAALVLYLAAATHGY